MPDLFESSHPSMGMASVEGCTYYSDIGMLPLNILAPHPQMKSTLVQETCISFAFLLHFFLEPIIQKISITCTTVNKTKYSFTNLLLIFLTSLWLVIVITFLNHCVV